MKLEEEVDQLPEKFASKSTIVVKYLREAFYRVPGVDYKSPLSHTAETIVGILNPLKDAKEGLQAFKEKRLPKWKAE